MQVGFRKYLFTFAILVGSGAAISPALQAHHSFSGVFNGDDKFEVTGTVTGVRFINPHASFTVNGAEKGGRPAIYSFELHSAVQMLRQGWKRNSLKVGDKITVSASRARATRTLGFVSWVEGADGKRLPTGRR